MDNFANLKCFPHKTPNVHAVFGRDAEFLQTYSASPCRPVDEGCVYFFSFSRRELGVSSGPKIQKQKKTTKYLAKTHTCTHRSLTNGLTGSYNTTRAKKSGSIFQKRCELPTDYTFLRMGFNLNQPVFMYQRYYYTVGTVGCIHSRSQIRLADQK